MIRIILLSAQTMITDIVHDAPGPASSATFSLVLRLSSTIDQLLLREGNELSRVDEVSSLHSTSSRERPARTASSLILDRSDSSLLSPVNSLRSITIDGGHTSSTRLRILSTTAELVGKLLLSNISELVHTQSPRKMESVMSLNLLKVVVVHSKTVSLLLRRRVHLSEILLVLQESRVTEVDTQCNCKKNKNKSLHNLQRIM